MKFRRNAYIIVLFLYLPCLAACASTPRYRTFAPDTKPSSSPEREKIVQVARSYIGAPYRRGGVSPAGVDCSGLVIAVYRSAGLRLPRTSKDQSHAGTGIARVEMRPGDLVFFSTLRSRSVSHVGIYIGDGKFIHASRRARRVCVDSLSLDYYKHRFVLARRVL